MKRLVSRLRKWWFRYRHPTAEEIGAEAKVVFASADEAAAAANAATIDTGHVLLGILRRTNLLKLLGADSEALEQDIVKSPKSTDGTLDHAKRVLEASVEEARRAGVRMIDAQLLLAGLCRLDDTLGHRVLASHNVTLEKVRALRPPHQERP